MMNKKLFIPFFILLVIAIFFMIKPEKTNGETKLMEEIKLTPPNWKGKLSLEEVLSKRRSIRDYKKEEISFEDFSQLLWSLQGITDKLNGLRTAPSAGALYPLEIYAVVGNVKGLKPGVYKYFPHSHSVKKILDGDKRKDLANSALGQESIIEGAVSFVITAVYSRTTRKYSQRGERYVMIEVGHAAQNLLLQATALNLGAVPIGAFYDNKVKSVLKLNEEEPLYIIPVGKK